MLNLLIRAAWPIMCWLLLYPASAFAVAIITPANTSISADTTSVAPGTGVYTAITGPILAEGQNKDINAGTILLNAPSGFEFRTAAGSVTVSVSCTGGGGSNLTLASPVAALSATQISITVQTAGTGSKKCTLTWSGIQARPTLSGTTLATGNITRSGTAAINGAPAGTSFGTLTEIAGAAKKLGFAQQPLDTVVSQAITPAVTVAIQDQFGNTVTSSTSQVTLALGANPAGGTLNGTTSVNAVAGIATFSTLSINKIGSGYTLAATSTGLTGATSNEFSILVGLDHIELIHDGSALTCTPKAVTVLGCKTSASCSGDPPSQYTTGSFTISLAQPAGTTWCSDSTCTAALGNPATISNGQTIYLKDTNAHIYRISGTSSAANTIIQCTNTTASIFNVTTACDVSFTASGFLVSLSDHVSCASSTLTVKAVQSSNNATVCVPMFSNTTRAETIRFSYNNPSSGTLAPTVGGTPISTSGTAVNLSFDSNGVATPAFIYQDVGKLSITVTDPSLPMTGSTGALPIITPASFSFSEITPGLIKAGSPFSAKITAMNGCATPAATPNFGKEITPEGVTLISTLVSPGGGNNPTLANNTIAGGAFTNGVATVSNLSWGEAGIIALTSNLASGNYLGSGLAATGTSGNVGPFIPHHFDTTVTPGCAAGSFTYSGQPFTVKVTAKNSAGGITQNYNAACGYAKTVTLSNAGSTASLNIGWPPPATPTQIMASTQFNNPAACGDTMNPPAGPNGEQGNVTFTFATPATTPVTIALRAVDTDGVTSSGFTEGTTEIRSGRIKLSNAHGSELLPLPIPIAFQYYTSSGWVPNTADSCSIISASNFAFSFPGNNLVACETAITVSGSAPAYSLMLAAPGNSNNGWTGLTLNLGTAAAGSTCMAKNGGSGFTGLATTANMPWLQFPWDGAGATNPSARATFGVYKGGNEFIYLRERY